jgi:(p)ppGpp synthase/HD superfamily hydrolase
MVLFPGVYPRLMRDSGVYDAKVELSALLEAMGSAGEADRRLVQDAYAFALEVHKDQKRMSGAAYFCHVAWVALELAQMGLDARTVAAALLHDTVEDSGVSLEKLTSLFGSEVADLVDGVTKISTRTFKSVEERQAENLRKMLVAMAKDIRVLLIKLSDRLHNLRTIRFLPEDKQSRIARETLDVYAPLAHRLGIAKWKWEMEDRSMAVLNPDSFQKLWGEIETSQGNRQSLLEQARLELENHLAAAGIKAEVMARSKHTYSIYQKMLNQHKGLLRPDGPAGHHQEHSRLLRGLRHRSRGMEAPAGPGQGLHRHAQEQHVPVAAYHGYRARRASPGDPGAHDGDAPHGRAGHRRPLGLQRGRA